MTTEAKWRPISELPPPGERPGRLFVLVAGENNHSGVRWLRQHFGVAASWNDGFNAIDIAHIETGGDMDRGSGRVTHFLPIELPHFPRPRGES